MRRPKFLRRRRPQLVIPAPVIKAHPLQSEPGSPFEAVVSDDHFLFGAEDVGPRHVTIQLPVNPLEMAALYRGLRPLRPGEHPRYDTTFDRDAEQERLRLVLMPVVKDSPGLVAHKGPSQ